MSYAQPDITSIVVAALRPIPGLRICTADSGERAIDLAFEMRPDLVLMDVMMPGLDGPGTLTRMHASALLAHVPVIFMTAKALPTEIAKFLQLGAIGVVVKPFDPLKLYGDLCTLWTAQDAAGGPAATLTATIVATESRAQVEENSLTASFLRRARADVTNLARLIGLAHAGDRSVFKEIERIAHSIHGAAAMFGFPDVSATGSAMARACQSGAPHQLFELNQQLARHVEAAWQTAPQSGAMFQGAAALM